MPDIASWPGPVVISMVNEGIPQAWPKQLLPELRINFKINALNAQPEPNVTEQNPEPSNIGLRFDDCSLICVNDPTKRSSFRKGLADRMESLGKTNKLANPTIDFAFGPANYLLFCGSDPRIGPDRRANGIIASVNTHRFACQTHVRSKGPFRWSPINWPTGWLIGMYWKKYHMIANLKKIWNIYVIRIT